MIPRPSLLIVTCAACLSVSARSVEASQAQNLISPILAKTSQPANRPLWASPIVLGGAGAVAIVGVTAVVVLKRIGRTTPEILEPITSELNPAPPSLPSSPSLPLSVSTLNGSALKSELPNSRPNAHNGNGRSQTTLQSEIPETLTQVVDSPKPTTPQPQPKIEETTRLAKVNIVEELIQELRSPDPVKRRKVIWELGQRGDTRAVQPLVDLLIDSDSKQRSLILSTLSEIGTRTLKPMTRALAVSLQDENAEVRKNAIRDLTRVYDMVSQISNLLHKATEDSDQDVQETAKWALGQLNRIRQVPGDNLPTLKNSISPPENLP
jgi:hypothetical protein